MYIFCRTSRVLLMHLLAAAFLILGAGAAQADDFSACPGPGGVGDKIQADMPGFDCVEIKRFKVGIMDVRIVRDRKTLQQKPTPYLDQVPIAFARSLDVWSKARPIRVQSVTVVVRAPSDPVGDVLADAEGKTAIIIAPARECVIMLNPLYLVNLAKKDPTATTPDRIGIILSHELAHCVEMWEWEDHYQTAGYWWMEGVAEFLASLAYPHDPAFTKHRYPGFAKHIVTVPLTSQRYETLVFFQWLWNRNPIDVFNFMAATPLRGVESGEDAQRLAILRFLGKGDERDGRQVIQSFAQAVIDGSIRNGGGEAIAPLARDKPVTVDKGMQVPVGGLPLTIHSRDVRFDKGAWVIARFATITSPAVRDPAAGGVWRPVPSEAGSADCSPGPVFRTGYMPTILIEKDAAITVAQTKSCKAAQTVLLSNDFAACVIGNWQLDMAMQGDMLRTWIGKSGTVTKLTGNIFWRLDGDGVAQISAAGYRSTIVSSSKPQATVTVGADGLDRGRWSAGAGKLQYVSGEAEIDLKVSILIGPIDQSVPDAHLFSSGNYDYQCTPNGLFLTYTGPETIDPDHRPSFHLIRAP